VYPCPTWVAMDENGNVLLFFGCYDAPRDLHSFPTRRSSDLCRLVGRSVQIVVEDGGPGSQTARLTRSSTASRKRARRGRRSSRRSEEHTSELQSRGHLVCRLLLEKKKMNSPPPSPATD